MEKPQPLEIGLSLTGTVSAGAYTAGVIDFLLEALEEWAKEKQANYTKYGNNYAEWEIPFHEVLIKGLSGASGGGVTCGLILNMLGRKFSPVTSLLPKDQDTDNDLFNAWVNKLGIEKLLSTEDLVDGQIKSLLFADAIPEVADKILQKERFGNTLRREYVAENLPAVITLTNLRGVPYSLEFKGATANRLMYYRHSDYMKLELAANNESQHKDAFTIPYDTNKDNFELGYAQLRAACLSTCAVPGGFKARPIKQDTAFYAMRNEAGLSFPPDLDYQFLTVDGGTLNTQPFELLHKMMLPKGAEHNPRDASDLTRTIIMVAPLETGDTFDTKYNMAKDNLADIAFPVISAMREEAMFSAQQVNLAFDETVYSRFIIAPVRNSSKDSSIRETPAITGSILGAFGAFISRDFRLHDYFLGRRNAQQFLRRHFALPSNEALENPIFSPLKASKHYNDFVFEDTYGKLWLPMIPLCGTAKNDQLFPEWPAGKGYDIDDIEALIETRIEKISDILVSGIKLNWLLRLIAPFIAKKAENAAVEKIMSTITDALKKSKLQ